MRLLRRFGLLPLLLLSLIGHGDPLDRPPEGASAIGLGDYRQGQRQMVVTANPIATELAYQVLQAGGSAVDAAITAQWVLGLVEPQSSGIGGGAFLLHYEAQRQRLTSLDGRETAPAAVQPDHFVVDGEPLDFWQAVRGGYSVGTPGVPALLWEAHQRWGKLPWAQLLAPAIEQARNGFALSARLHQLLEQLPQLAHTPALREYFYQHDGQPLAVGTRLRNPAYADTLSQLRDGVEPFYHGALAEQLVNAVQHDPRRPGLLSRADLAAYRVIERAPVCAVRFGYTACGMAPPSSGGTTVLAILGLLEASQSPTSSADPAGFIHHFAEASRLAFADRNHYVADPAFVEIPTAGLVDSRYLGQRAALIDPRRTQPQVSAGQPPGAAHLQRQTSASPQQPSTTHLSVVDRWGNVVSMTSSIEMAFGAQLMVGGFLLNNQLTDFSFMPRQQGEWVANRPEGGKRPRSSMAPFIVLDQHGPVLAIGSPGGARIIDYVARSLALILGEQRSLAEVLATPHVVQLGRALELEPGYDEVIWQALRQRGQTPVERDQTSGLAAIWISPKGLAGAADPRREGRVAGD